MEKEAFFQKRAPESRPPWIDTVELAFPSGRTADEVVVSDAAQLAWVVNLGCVDLNPHPVRADDLEHPDELRIDLDPVPGVAWSQLVEVAAVARGVLEDYGLAGWPKTSGSRGIHVYARVARRWVFSQLRHAALAVAREVERRAPTLATSKWWKEERHGVFLDYNQNAKDRTVASAYSVRPTPDARVSMPLSWDDLRTCDPADFTIFTVPARFAERGDASAGIDEAAGSLESLLALSEKQLAELGEAPLPPHYAKEENEPPRVQPSKRRAPARLPGPPAMGDSPTGNRKSSKPLLVDRARAIEGGRAGRAGAVEGAPPRGRAAPGSEGRAGRQHARSLADLDPHPGQPGARPGVAAPAAEPPDPDVDPMELK